MHYTRTRQQRSRFGNSDILAARRAVRIANARLHTLLKPAYFTHVPLTDIFRAVESAGLTFDPDERTSILTGRQGRAHWALYFHNIPIRVALWISWYKMESGRYEVIGAIT